MGRTERGLDPDAGPLQRFAWELRLLREGAGRPGYRELAARVHFSMSRLSEAAAGRSLPSLAVTRAYVQGCGGNVEEWVHRWYQVRKDLDAIAAESAEGAGEPPYLGLATFGAGDADRFFGRGQLTDELLTRVADTPLLAVVGASGSGKSSLLCAGLLSKLDGEAVLFTPGAQPLRRLSAVLSRLTGSDGDREVAEPPETADPDRVRVAVRRVLAALPEAARITLVVDQFEELFTLCSDLQVRERFIDCLLAIAGDGDDDGRVRVVLGVRADFYAHCAQHAGLVPVLRDAQVLVGPMTGAELRDAITGPAEQAGWCLEPALVDAIVADASGQPGVLPLVSHALLETWRRRQGRNLTLTGFHAAGGLSEAVSRSAEHVYTGLDPKRQDIAHDLFLRLTALGEGTDDTRRRVPYHELSDDDAVRDVLDDLAAARLITCDIDDVSVSHEALIRRWPRLRDWLTADRDQLLAHRRLTEAATEWGQHGRDEAILYRGRRLAQWDEPPAGRRFRLNPAESAFLEACRHLERREAAVRRRRTHRAVSLLACVTVLVSALAMLSVVQARRATDERDQALSGQLAAAAGEQLTLQPDLSLLLARKALAIRQTPAAEGALRQAVLDDRLRSVLTTGQPQVFGVAYAPDGHRIATSGDTGTVRIWHLGPDGTAQGPPRVLSGHQGEVWSPVFSPDGRLLAACGLDGTATVWDLSTGAAPLVLRGHTGKVWRVAFSPDGRSLASTGDDGTVRIWNPATGAPIRTVVHTAARQLGLAYSPDGKHLAAGDDAGLIRVWDTSGSSLPVVLRGHTNTVQNLTFTPGSTALVSASTDGTARVWHLGTPGGDPVVLRGDSAGTIETVATSPDGSRVAAAGSDGTVRVFDLDGQDDPLILPGHDGTVWSLAFSPRGDRLLSGSGDGTARFWDPAYPGTPQILRAPPATPLETLAASHDGHLLVTGGDDGTVRIWHPATSATPMILQGHQGPVDSVAVNPAATQVASGGSDGTVRIWDTTTGNTQILDRHATRIDGVAFLPDGYRVAVADGLGLVRVWDLTTNTFLDLIGHQSTVRSITASPDDRHLASTGRDGTVRIWDLTTHHAQILTGHRGGLVWQAIFSPDGRHLASSGDDGTIRIWDLTTTPPGSVVLHGHRGSVWTIAYSPDGKLLASSGADGGLRIWQTSTATLLASIHGYGSPIEQAVFGPDTAWIATVHDDGTLRLSHCDACAPLTQIQEQADHLATRKLTPAEQRQYLPNP
jgi:WD40 repeat protein